MLLANSLWALAFVAPVLADDAPPAEIALGRFLVFGMISLLTFRWRLVRALPRRLLMQALDHIDESSLLERFDSAARLVGLSLSRHADTPGAFRGKHAEIRFNSLVDMMAGLISAEVSDETRVLLGQ